MRILVGAGKKNLQSRETLEGGNEDFNFHFHKKPEAFCNVRAKYYYFIVLSYSRMYNRALFFYFYTRFTPLRKVYNFSEVFESLLSLAITSQSISVGD